MKDTTMTHLHLTDAEARWLRSHLRSAAMNERGNDAAMAERIHDQMIQTAPERRTWAHTDDLFIGGNA